MYFGDDWHCGKQHPWLDHFKTELAVPVGRVKCAWTVRSCKKPAQLLRDPHDLHGNPFLSYRDVEVPEAQKARLKGGCKQDPTRNAERKRLLTGALTLACKCHRLVTSRLLFE